jgi:ribonuclease BN (tRNA processing enzyme)
MNGDRIWALCLLIALVSVTVLATGDEIANTTGLGYTGNLQEDESDIQRDLSSGEEQPARIITGPAASDSRTRLVLLGTTGGISWYPDNDQASSSSALVIGDTLYIIDLGQGSSSRLSEAFNTKQFIEACGGKIENKVSTVLENVRAVFFTHLHMDHTADYPDFLLIGPGTGLGTSFDLQTNKTVSDPVIIIGPGNRGELEADRTDFIQRGGQVIYTDSADPALITPTPGTRQMTNLIWQGFAQAINDITLDGGYPDYRSVVTVREIGGPEPDDILLPVSVPDPNNETCPAMDPFEVYQDDKVRVTATLVDHHQVYPSFAFRFDTEDGSIVFSGDTGPDTNGNLQKLADGADILVHEVIDRAWIDNKFGDPKPGSRMEALKTHMLQSHTANDVVGGVATECGVNTLVLNHIVPAGTSIQHLEEAKKNFSGNLIIGEDLMQIGISRDSRSSEET